MKKIVYTIVIVIALSSCNNSRQENKTQEQNPDIIEETQKLLIGNSGKITFPEMTAEVKYLNDSTLHWKTTDSKGTLAEGDEKIDYQKLTDNLHFLNWVEKDGWTVSQIINTKEGTVKAYWSFADEKSMRGKRTSMFVDGKFEFIK
jgi:hypothetical protein